MKNITKILFILIILGVNINLYAMGSKPKKGIPAVKKELKDTSAIKIKSETKQSLDGFQNKRDILPSPVYLSILSNINDYYAFATSGWDGSWYVGYNACWIVRLPAAPKGDFEKAYIGVKLGRMKSIRVEGKPQTSAKRTTGSMT